MSIFVSHFYLGGTKYTVNTLTLRGQPYYALEQVRAALGLPGGASPPKNLSEGADYFVLRGKDLSSILKQGVALKPGIATTVLTRAGLEKLVARASQANHHRAAKFGEFADRQLFQRISVVQQKGAEPPPVEATPETTPNQQEETVPKTTTDHTPDDPYSGFKGGRINFAWKGAPFPILYVEHQGSTLFLTEFLARAMGISNSSGYKYGMCLRDAERDEFVAKWNITGRRPWAVSLTTPDVVARLAVSSYDRYRPRIRAVQAAIEKELGRKLNPEAVPLRAAAGTGVGAAVAALPETSPEAYPPLATALYAQLRDRAAEEKRAVQDVVEEAVRRYLSPPTHETGLQLRVDTLDRYIQAARDASRPAEYIAALERKRGNLILGKDFDAAAAPETAYSVVPDRDWLRGPVGNLPKQASRTDAIRDCLEIVADDRSTGAVVLCTLENGGITMIEDLPVRPNAQGHLSAGGVTLNGDRR